MKEHLNEILRLLDTPSGRLQLTATLVSSLCVFFMIAAVLMDFIAFHRRTDVKERTRSRVATGTMVLFFIGLYLLIRFRVGEVEIAALSWRTVVVLAGLAIMVAGCAVGTAGRLNLGQNWANQITVYQSHVLVTKGAYRFMRHPLYASLIWMSYGASLAYVNAAAFLATTLVFVPMMVVRARREETVLAHEFPEYTDYRRRTGMFSPWF